MRSHCILSSNSLVFLICFSSGRSEASSSRDEEAWLKLSSLWNREAARWDQERSMWDQKEKRLMDTIYQLQQLVINLSNQPQHASLPLEHTQQAPLQQTPVQQEEILQGGNAKQATTASAAQAPAAGKAQAESSSQAASKPPQIPIRQGSQDSKSVLEQASQYLPPEPEPFRPESPEEFAPLEVCDRVEKWSAKRIECGLQLVVLMIPPELGANLSSAVCLPFCHICETKEQRYPSLQS